MPKNRKTPDLADWQVCFTDPARQALTVRAVSLHRSGGDYVLDDGTGYPLFSAPREGVLYVRHLEPGHDVPAAEEAPREIAAPSAAERERTAAMMRGDTSAIAAPAETGPSGRRRAAAKRAGQRDG